MQEETLESRTCFGRGLMPAMLTPLVCYLWRWLDGAPVCSEVCHRVHWICGLLGDAGQGQLHLCPAQVPPNMSYKVIFRWLLLVLGLDVSGRGQDENLRLAAASARPEAT